MREPLYSLACENFSRFHQQGEHNASCFFMLAAQSPPKEPLQIYEEIGKAKQIRRFFLIFAALTQNGHHDNNNAKL